jgi:hypothetical protein
VIGLSLLASSALSSSRRVLGPLDPEDGGIIIQNISIISRILEI